MHNFKELTVWQRAKDLTILIYQATENYPSTEKFALANQMRKCAVSIPSNIAEGCGRNTDKQLIHFLHVTMGSLSELETQLIISNELGFIEDEISRNLIKEVNELQKMTRAFGKRLKANL